MQLSMNSSENKMTLIIHSISISGIFLVGRNADWASRYDLVFYMLCEVLLTCYFL